MRVKFEKLMKFKKPARVFALALAVCMIALMFPIRVQATGGLEVSIDFPGITALPGDTPSFEVTFTNESESPLNAALSVLSIPDGWGGRFNADNKQINRIHVPAREDNNTAHATFTHNPP